MNRLSRGREWDYSIYAVPVCPDARLRPSIAPI